MPPVEHVLDDEHARTAMEQALTKYPAYRDKGPRLVRVPLRQGSALLLRWAVEPARDDKDAWEFQNAACKGYRALAGE